jgi:PPP family 3-phenylpropionic acid transporter
LIVAIGTVAYSATQAPIIPISNSLVLRQGFDYGYVRSFGSIAFGISILITGFALSGFTTSLVVYLYVVGMGVFVLLVLGLPEVEETVFERNLGSKAIELFGQSKFQVVLLTAFLLGGVSTSGGAFFSVYMREIGLGDGFTGVAWALKTAAEALLFVYIGRTALSYGTIVAIGGASFAAGYLGLSFLPTLGPVLLANLGLGAGVSLLYFALVNLAHDCAPKGLHSTAQTLLTSIGVGAGGAVGQAITGWLVDAVGVQQMYLYLGGGALVLASAGLAVHSVVRENRAATA